LGLSIYAGVNSVNVTTSAGGASGISASFSPTPFSTTYGITGVSLTATLTATNVSAGTYNVSVTALGSTSNTVAFTVADPTPVITPPVSEAPTLTADSQAYITIYGSNFGSSAGQVSICTNDSGTCSPAADVSATLNATYGFWDNTQVNALVTAASTASGNYYVQLTAATDAAGNSFLEAPQQQQGNQSNYAQVQVSGKPGSIKAVSANPSSISGCPTSTIYGQKVDVVYQVYDTSGNKLQVAGLQPWEQITGQKVVYGNPPFTATPPDQPFNPQGAPTLGTTDSNGQFHDNPLGACQTLLPYTYTGTQQIAFLDSSGNATNIVRTNALTFTIDANGTETVSNGSDVPIQQ
jgi:hypothetical protein